MDANGLQEFFQAAAAAALVARLATLRLTGSFPALLTWLVSLGITESLASIFAQDSGLYFWLYLASVPLMSVLGILAVRELLALVFRDYPGIRSVGRTAAYAAAVSAGAISLLAAFLIPRSESGGSRHLFYAEVLQRSVVFTLALVILTVLFFLSFYPLRLSRNTILSANVFSVMFLSDAVRLLIDSLQTGLNNRVVDWTQAAIMVVCLTTWVVLLGPDSEPARGNFSGTNEDHLLRQLDSLNQVLTRVARN